jgi:RluA family pseudouridine synthase
VLVTLYSDRHLAIFDKPAGIPVIPGRDGGASLVAQTGLLVVHRLDADTSGVLVMARTTAGQRMASAAFAQRRVEKTYAAVVAAGAELAAEGVVDLPIGRWHRGRVAVGTGKSALTRWSVRWRTDARAGLTCNPVTGRTHQVRAHLAAAGAPIVGDPMYGGPEGDRLYLHAWRLRLPWPGPADLLEIESPLPAGFG